MLRRRAIQKRGHQAHSCPERDPNMLKVKSETWRPGPGQGKTCLKHLQSNGSPIRRFSEAILSLPLQVHAETSVQAHFDQFAPCDAVPKQRYIQSACFCSGLDQQYKPQHSDPKSKRSVFNFVCGCEKWVDPYCGLFKTTMKHRSFKTSFKISKPST